MKLCTYLAALLALCNWTFVMTGQAMAHGGTDFAVLDCEDEEGDESARTFECDGEEECDGEDAGDAERAVLDCEDEEGDAERAVLECDEEDGDAERAVLDCEDEEGDDGAAVLDCHDDEESEE